MSKYKTHDDFIKEMFVIHPNIEILSTYTRGKDKVHARCNIDGYEWYVRGDSLLRGYNCPRCSGKERKTPERFREEVSNVTDTIEVIDDYVNISTKLSCKCKVCGSVFMKWPRDLLCGSGCRVCNNRERYTTESFKSKLSSINPDVTVIGDYTYALSYIRCRCNKCGLEWDIKASHLLGGHGCPHCKSSNGEKAIAKYLDSRGIEYCKEKRFKGCKYKYTLPFDFYIQSMNIAIEFDGTQHFQPVNFNGADYDANAALEEQKIKDGIKTQYCIDNGIKLIRIPYTDYENIDSILDKQIQ